MWSSVREDAYKHGRLMGVVKRSFILSAVSVPGKFVDCRLIMVLKIRDGQERVIKLEAPDTGLRS